MAHPLELSYHWRAPVSVASVAAVACIGFVLRSQAPGRWGVAAVVLALWAAFVVTVWTRTRAQLSVDGPLLTVRRVRQLHTVRADQLVRVRQFLTPHGPSYVLHVRDEDGGERRLVAPVALLRSGHSTLFGWILAHAPHAELDRGSTRTLEQLRVRGLVT